MSSELPRPFGPVYTLLKLLARGGMGEIYLARTTGITGFEKYYAIKKLLKKFIRDNDVGARFIDEAKLGARLQHPNIVQVYDLGRVGDELYMATEFVDGFDLRRVLRFCHEKSKRIPLDIALFIVREVLSGLAYAHRQLDAEGRSINLIHRDISPQNVLVSFEGEVKVIDFGLAKSTQRSQETQTNTLLGNFGYMSPEQARGNELDVRTDVYSAGIVLFELVTGTKRFVDDNPLRLLEMVARPTPVLPSDRVPSTPRTVDRIYARAAAPKLDDRYASADAFRDDINAALHRVNTKASRENLAQFLNHLFLGGAPPPPVDSNLLDKSVAIRVRDLYENTDAFQRTAEHDAGDRRLQEFSDDAPQTASHPRMRAARVGDTLTHAELTGAVAVTGDLTGDLTGAAPAGEAPDAEPAPAVVVGSLIDSPPFEAIGTSPTPFGSEIVGLPPVELPETLSDIDELGLVPPGGATASATIEPAPLEAEVEVEVDADMDVGSDTPWMSMPAVLEHDLLLESDEMERTRPSARRPVAPVAAPVTSGRPPRAPQASHGQAAIVTIVAPAAKRPDVLPEEPSIVVAGELEPEESTVAGETTSSSVRAVSSSMQSELGFGDGEGESLIIDFDGESGPMLAATIRPAAKPLGWSVASAVEVSSAKPRRPGTSGGGEEGTPEPSNSARRKR